MKYYQTLIVLICLMSIVGILTAQTETELLQMGLIYIVSIIVVLIACFIHLKETK